MYMWLNLHFASCYKAIDKICHTKNARVGEKDQWVALNRFFFFFHSKQITMDVMVTSEISELSKRAHFMEFLNFKLLWPKEICWAKIIKKKPFILTIWIFRNLNCFAITSLLCFWYKIQPNTSENTVLEHKQFDGQTVKFVWTMHGHVQLICITKLIIYRRSTSM